MGMRRRVRLFVSRDGFGRFVSCLVYLPRDRYTTTSGSTSSTRCNTRSGERRRLHRAGRRVGAGTAARRGQTPDGAPEVDPQALESELAAIVRAWLDDLRDALVAREGEEVGVAAFRVWSAPSPRVPGRRRARRTTVADVAVLDEASIPPSASRSRLDRHGAARPGSGSTGRAAAGALRRDAAARAPRRDRRRRAAVRDRRPRAARGGSTRSASAPHGRSARPTRRRRTASPSCSSGCGRGRSRTTGSTAWCCAPGLDGARRRDACARCASTCSQAGVRLHRGLPGRHARREPRRRRGCSSSCSTPASTRRDRPIARTRPRSTPICERASTRSRASTRTASSARCRHVVEAAVRTNAYRDEPYLAVKLDPTALDFLPAPRPQHEVWVYSPLVEGVHLRAGDIARGGIRWSDRREDFRTEVLGLMKAQTVKNAVIVPVGAKGGFVVKQPPADRDGLRGRGASRATAPSSAACSTSPTTWSTAGGPAARRRAPRRRRSLPRGRRRQGHGDLLRRRRRARGRVRLLARRCLRVRRLGRLRPQGHGHHLRAGRGSGCGRTSGALGIDADIAPLHRRRDRRHVGRRVRQRPAAIAAPEVVAAFDHRHVFLDPDPDPAASFAERATAVRAPGVVVGGLRPCSHLRRWWRVPAQRRKVGAALARRCSTLRARVRCRDGHARGARSSPRFFAHRSISCGTAASAPL